MKLETLSRLAAFGLTAALVYVSVCPIELRPQTETTVNLDRMVAFAVLGGAFALGYPRHRLLVLLLLPLGALAMEALQFVEPTRHPQLPDAIFKALGVTAGAGFAYLATGWLARRLRLSPR